MLSNPIYSICQSPPFGLSISTYTSRTHSSLHQGRHTQSSFRCCIKLEVLLVDGSPWGQRVYAKRQYIWYTMEEKKQSNWKTKTKPANQKTGQYRTNTTHLENGRMGGMPKLSLALLSVCSSDGPSPTPGSALQETHCCPLSFISYLRLIETPLL